MALTDRAGGMYQLEGVTADAPKGTGLKKVDTGGV